MLKKVLCVFLLAQSAFLSAQTLWADLSETQISGRAGSVRYIVPRRYRSVRLDLSQLKPVLATAPERFTNEAAEQLVTLTLPLPDGGWGQFRITESPVMAPALQAQYPEIRCYTGVGLDDPTATLKCDLTPQGFHAMIRTAAGNTVFIDPYRQADSEHYIAYYKRDFQHKKAAFSCGIDQPEDAPVPKTLTLPDLQGDCKLRRYRLALACTGEYAQFHGGTTALTLAAMNTTMNRVNGIYERDLGITMQLIANNNLLVFLDPATDGYTNGNGNTMLTQNQTKCNSVIGSANYDIGHVFSTGGGGIAGLGVVCGNSGKALGVTGTNQPIGDPFDVDYVAHEMGHQFGANHCFNNDCSGNINPSTAFEPGSGSTIMAYAGVCAPNIQNNSDAYFHAISLQEIGAYVTASQGGVCAFQLSTNNQPPVVNAGADYIIPKSTPFALTATGSDPNGDPMTFCWEQMDKESAPMPPATTNTSGPLFRSYDPLSSPTRYFPRLQDLVANTAPTWEVLPGVNRTINFRVTARDNHAGGGCTAEDDMKVTVAAGAGPFQVTAPNTALTWFVGDTKNITWDVANTTAAPVNCARVRIRLSTDGGFTYPVVVADDVPNNGSASIVVPNAVSATCRIKVEAIGNVFFDISNQNLKIELPPAPTFLLTTSASAFQTCLGQPLAFTADLSSISGFSSPVQLSLNGLPAGASAQITPNPITPNGNASISLTDLNTPGDYPLTLTATSGTITRAANIALTVFNGAPTLPALSVPTNGGVNVSLNPTLSWSPAAAATAYRVQVAPSPAFDAGTYLLDETTTNTAIAVPGLALETVYYWRVKAENACGTSDFTPAFAFQTGKSECGFTYNSTNVPVSIADNAIVTVNSTLNVPVSRVIADVNLSVQANHTWVGDLVAELKGPDGETVALFDQPGFPSLSSGCGGDNLNLIFDDEATQTADDLENTCGNLPALSGAFQPLGLLRQLDNRNAQGTWILSMTDNFPEDGGAITAWSLQLCFLQAIPAGVLVTNAPLAVIAGQAAYVTTKQLVLQIESGNPNKGLFVLLSPPQHGALQLNGIELTTGDVFTQADILSNSLEYVHNGDAATADAFHFDALDAGNHHWVHDSVFHFTILQNDLAVSVAETKSIQCSGDANGQLTVSVSGGTAPYQFTLNGGTAQYLPVFDGLAAGTYSIVVTDQNGFTADSGPITLDNPPTIVLLASVVTDDILASASGGTGTPEYSLDGQVFQGAGVFENLVNGTYTVTARDGNGCTATTTVTVEVDSLVTGAMLEKAIACYGGTDGAIKASAAGGVGPYQYSLNGVDFQSDGIFSGLPAGPYTVTVKDDSGNTATATITLGQPTQIHLSVVVSNDDITATAGGGTGALAYSLDGVIFQGTPAFINVPNGAYTITARDANGCTATAMASVDIPALAAALNITRQNRCAGSKEGEIIADATGGVAPYAYSLNGVDFQAGHVFSGLGAGAYTVVVKDDSGRTATANTVMLTDPPVIAISAFSVLNTITVSATGGTGALEFSLDGQNFQTSSFFDALANAVYTVTARDTNGCTATTEVTVDVPPLTVYGLKVSGQINCAGETIDIVVLVTGGVPPYAYSLDGGAFQNDSLFTQVGAGLHTLLVRDDAGAESDFPYVLAGPDPLVATPEILGNDVVVQAGGGVPPYQFALDSLPAQDSGIFNDLATGSYSVVVTDANGCQTTASFEVSYVPMTLQATGVNPLCPGTSNGSIAYSVTGGTPPFTCSVNSGACTLTGLSAGVYTVVVADAVGNAVQATVTLNDPPALIGSAAVQANTITVMVSGGTGTLEYSLDGDDFQTSPVFTDVPNGTYVVRIRDANGCLWIIGNVVVDYVGTLEPTQAWGLVVSPNPSTGVFQLTMRQAPAEAVRADVFDTAGRRMRSYLLEPVQGQLAAIADLTGLPGGVYWLRLTSGSQVGAVRLVLQP